MESKDLDRINPDWDFAETHAKSLRPGIVDKEKNQICDCCLNVVHKEPVSLYVHSKELEFLGFGFPLWYLFLKSCAMLLLVIVVTQSTFSLYMALKHNHQLCGHQVQSLTKTKHLISNRKFQIHDKESTGNNIQHLGQQTQQYFHLSHPHITPNKITSSHQPNKTTLSTHQPDSHHDEHHSCIGLFIMLSRRQKYVTQPQQLLRITTFFITLFILLFIRDTMYKTQQYYDQRRCSLGDYSIMFSKLPKIKGIQSRITSYLKQNFNPSINIQKIILIPQVEQFQKYEEQKKQEVQKMKKYQKELDNKDQGWSLEHNDEIQEFQKKLKQIQEKEQKEIKEFQEQLKNDTLQSQGAIVILSTESQKYRVLEEFQTIGKNDNLKKYFEEYGNQMEIKVEIQQAPEPREIMWENVNYPSGKRFGKILLGWTLSVLFIAVITVVFYFILQKKSEFVQEKTGHKRATFMVYFALILVILFNKFVMGIVLHHLTEMQKHATSDKLQFSFALKYALGMFFTTALMTVFVEAIHFQNFDKHPFGVIDQQSIMFFMNSFLVPIIWMINPFQLMVLWKRSRNQGKKYFTQRQANHFMEDFSYDIGKRYAEVLQTIWFTFMYLSLIPMGSFLTLIGIGLYYWVDKYNLLRRSSIHENVSGKFSIIALKMLDFILVLIPLGWLIFDFYLKTPKYSISYISVIFLILGIIYMCIPLNKILDYFSKQSFTLQQKPYKQVKINFKDTYINLHPIYSKMNRQKIIKKRQQLKQNIVRRLSTKFTGGIQQIWPKNFKNFN